MESLKTEITRLNEFIDKGQYAAAIDECYNIKKTCEDLMKSFKSHYDIGKTILCVKMVAMDLRKNLNSDVSNKDRIARDHIKYINSAFESIVEKKKEIEDEIGA